MASGLPVIHIPLTAHFIKQNERLKESVERLREYSAVLLHENASLRQEALERGIGCSWDDIDEDPPATLQKRKRAQGSD